MICVHLHNFIRYIFLFHHTHQFFCVSGSFASSPTPVCFACRASTKLLFSLLSNMLVSNFSPNFSLKFVYFDYLEPLAVCIFDWFGPINVVRWGPPLLLLTKNSPNDQIQNTPLHTYTHTWCYFIQFFAAVFNFCLTWRSRVAGFFLLAVYLSSPPLQNSPLKHRPLMVNVP